MRRGEMDWLHFQKQFPVNEELIWLNNCGTTPANRRALKAVETFLRGYARRGILAAGYPPLRQSIVQRLSEVLDCSPGELCLVHNTAEAMNQISRGLDLKTGQTLLLVENEYPSNVYPWRHWSRRGVRIETVPLGQSPEQFLENLKDFLTPAVGAVCLTSVHWCTGMPLPLAEAGKLCATKGARLIVDAAQGIGMLPLRPREWGISFLAFPAWKWLLGPLGLGGMFVASDALEALEPAFTGPGTMAFESRYLPYQQRMKPHAGRFEFSTPSLADWVYFDASLGLLAEVGWEALHSRILWAAKRLRDGLVQRGFTLAWERDDRPESGILAFSKPGLDAGRWARELTARGVVCTHRLGRLRWGPHAYLDEAQLDAALCALDAVR